MKKITIYIIEFIIFGLAVTSVLSASNSDIAKANLTSSMQEVKGGQEVVVTLKFDKYKEKIKGINAFKATLDYDKEIFEKVEQKDFKVKNDWEELKYNQGTGEFVAIKKAGSREEDIVQIVLKVKEDVEPGKTNIAIENIITSEGIEDLLLNNTNIQIDIIKDQILTPDQITSEKYKIEGEFITRILPETKVSEFIKNVTTDQELVFIDNNGNELKEDDIIPTGTKLKVGSTKQYTLIAIGDIDRDAKITINDLANAKLHLIESEILSGIELKAADVDGDNDVTINDIAQIKLVLIGLKELNELK